MSRESERLHSVGLALHGPEWQTPLSRDLGVSDRTVRRWASGENDIPPGVWAELGQLCEKAVPAAVTRAEALKVWAQKLRHGG